MHWLIEIMDRTLGVDCWWNNRLASRIIDHAHRLGLVYRPSTSQVEWTEKGAAKARRYSVTA